MTQRKNRTRVGRGKDQEPAMRREEMERQRSHRYGEVKPVSKDRDGQGGETEMGQKRVWERDGKPAAPWICKQS